MKWSGLKTKPVAIKIEMENEPSRQMWQKSRDEPGWRRWGRGKWGCGGFPCILVTFPDSPTSWACSPHSTESDMASRRALPPNPELVTKARTRTLANLTSNLRLTALANWFPSNWALLTVFFTLRCWLIQQQQGIRKLVLTPRGGHGKWARLQRAPMSLLGGKAQKLKLGISRRMPTCHLSSWGFLRAGRDYVFYRICNASAVSNIAPNPH